MIEITKNHPNIQKINSFFLQNYLPIFLGIDEIKEKNDTTIHVIICSRLFNKQTTDQRILNIFNLIKLKEPDILNTTKIVVEAYSIKEMEDLITYYV